jgi:hypothetical protein
MFQIVVTPPPESSCTSSFDYTRQQQTIQELRQLGMKEQVLQMASK